MMRFLWMACLCLSVTAGELSLDEVVARHVKAKGGLAKWDAVKSSRLTGTFTAFSIPKPVTITRGSGGKLMWQGFMGQQPLTLGIGSKGPWWINTFISENPDNAPAAEAPLVYQWADFATPLMHYKARGYQLELLGEQELEGEPGIALKLTRENGFVETWYLNPDTWLEMGRVSKGADFTEEQERQTTWFDDFRDVKGLQIPFLVETQFWTRHRLLEVDKIELDVDLTGIDFEKPFPASMQHLRHMLGEWEIAVKGRPHSAAKFTDYQVSSSVVAELDGIMFIERSERDGKKLIRTWGYDPYRKHYHIQETDTETGYPNIFRGQLEDGTLMLDTLDSNTYLEMGGTYYHRYTLKDLKPNSFVLLYEVSENKGESWATLATFNYSRKK